MSSDIPKGHSVEEVLSPGVQPLPFLQCGIQLENIFPVEISAKRFPMTTPVNMETIVMTHAQTELSLVDLGINAEVFQAQIHLEVRVSFPQEPRLFEISFKLAGIFHYNKEYSPEMVQQFLQNGSLSIMLPSARELLLSICTRLQVPAVVLPLIQVAPPQTIDTEKK